MIKSSILWLHKWLGICSGIVVFILSITGCIYTFQDELKLWAYPEKYFIDTADVSSSPLPLSTLLSNAQASLEDGQKISRVDLYPAKDRTWVFRAMQTDENAFGHWNYFNYYKRIFINPYTGEVKQVENTKAEFFQLVLQLHLNLLLGKKYGHAVVSWSTALFVVILLTGIVLWWPKKWKGKNFRRSIWLDTKVKWKRLNHDLHNVLGFYSLFFALAFAVTGLAFAFPGFKKTYVATFNLFQQEKASKTPTQPTAVPLVYQQFQDNALYYSLKNYPQAEMLSIRVKKDTAQEMDIQIRRFEKRSGVFNWLYFDKKEASLKHTKSSDNLRFGDKLATLNYDIHTGNIGGIVPKIIAFMISLFCASLPITGYIIWLNKSKKKKRS
ncbi:MAG: PepSY domain-containing protein [Sphingobacterium sp.]|jgi:uncharacterized iron-regulated membrane protein|nr:PepSY domain-containing protein [Sphingobacterium sp.]